METGIHRRSPMPWAIPPWLALVKFLGLTAKEHNKHDDDGDSNDNDANDKDGGDGNNDNGEVEHDGGDDDDNEDDDDDNRTTTMRWRRVRQRCKVEAGGMVCLLCVHEKIGSLRRKRYSSMRD